MFQEKELEDECFAISCIKCPLSENSHFGQLDRCLSTSVFTKTVEETPVLNLPNMSTNNEVKIKARFTKCSWSTETI